MKQADCMSEHPNNPWAGLEGEPVIAPSLLACDFACPAPQIDAVLAAGAQVLHVDIMDGHFVPNLSMGPGFAKKIRQYSDAPLDVHLMLTDPACYIERFADAGVDSITFHIEACCGGGSPERPTGPDEQTHATETALGLIDRLHKLGCGAGITLRPGTPADSLEGVLDAVDLVLVMTVEPGYGGQSFMADQLPKIEQIRRRLRPEQRLEVDGGINPETCGRCARAGADTFVAGNNIFAADDIPAAVRALRTSAGG
jgi:ribulose-phosphate 3-epimerase